MLPTQRIKGSVLGYRGVGALDQMVRLINILFVSSKSFCGILPVRKASLYKCQVFRGCLQLSMLGCSRANMAKSSICCFIVVSQFHLSNHVALNAISTTRLFPNKCLGNEIALGWLGLSTKHDCVAITLRESGQSE